MTPILYTTAEAVRSTLGIREEDMSTQSLLDRDLSRELLVDLNGWLPTHATLNASGGVQATRLALYCKYLAASIIASSSAVVGTFMKLSDGVNSMERFNPINWQEFANSLLELANAYKWEIQDALGEATAVTGTFAQLVLSDPARDPRTTGR